ncbi:hypothetical protein J6590_072793 [Homalodisca vitripennis]|nr:hypothetical protein J6590_072793 [Homalodisca vitripennis]
MKGLFSLHKDANWQRNKDALIKSDVPIRAAGALGSKDQSRRKARGVWRLECREEESSSAVTVAVAVSLRTDSLMYWGLVELLDILTSQHVWCGSIRCFSIFRFSE